LVGGTPFSIASSHLVAPPSTQLWSSVYDLYWYLGVGAGVVVFALLIYIMFRYRDNPKRPLAVERTKENRETWRGTLALFAVMGVILTLIAVQTINGLVIYENPPNNPGKMTVDVVAAQFFFTFDYQNNKSSATLVVPVNTEIVLNVTSKDVNHQFGIPDFRVKTDAIPGRHNIVWIQPNAVGNYTIQCFELCGVGHATMITTMVVMSQPAFAVWYNSTGP